MRRAYWIIPVGILVAGCVPAEADLPLDLDGDGLLIEDEWGTDPENPDSDEDGYLDGAEVGEGTDPLDASDHPYAGGWHIDACRDDIVSEGDDIGQVARNWSAEDQYGEMVSLHDFCGRVVYIEGSGFS